MLELKDEKLLPGDKVIIRTPTGLGNSEKRLGTVISGHTAPESYIVDAGDSNLRRNRVDLTKCPDHFTESSTTEIRKVPEQTSQEKASPEKTPDQKQTFTSPIVQPGVRTTRSGREIKMPKRLGDYV